MWYSPSELCVWDYQKNTISKVYSREVHYMKVKDLIYSCSLLADYIFFCVLGIFGSAFGGSEDSPIYKVFMTVVGVYVISVTLLGLLRRELYTTKTVWVMMVGLPLFVIASYFWETGAYILDLGQMNKYLLFMACFSYPAICTGIYMAHYGIEHFVKYFDIAVYIITLSITLSISGGLTDLVSVGGASYQTMAYLAGFSFCYTLCMIFWGDKYKRFSLFASDSWRKVSYALLPVQLLACLISGGRGGFVVLAVGAGYMIFRSRKFGRVFTLGSIALLITMAAGSFVDTPLSDALEKSTSRTFNYLNAEDDASAKRVTGREGVYEHAIEIIQEDNYMGRGLFRTIQEGYPHNIFLEMCEQGGVLYVLFWAVMLLYIFRRTHLLMERENGHVLLPFMFFAYILLLFSGSYIAAPLFWYLLSYVLARCEIIKP